MLRNFEIALTSLRAPVGRGVPVEVKFERASTPHLKVVVLIIYLGLPPRGKIIILASWVRYGVVRWCTPYVMIYKFGLPPPKGPGKEGNTPNEFYNEWRPWG
jgi:hypothetical protein